jgi:hypothetical protein
MKKMLFCLLVLGMVLAGCTEPDNGPQKKLRITNIPAEHNGRYGFSGFGKGENLAAYSDGIRINSGSVINAMLDNNTDKPYSKNGKYTILFLITDSSYNQYWTGYIEEDVNITLETTTLSFSQFTEIPPSSPPSSSSQKKLRFTNIPSIYNSRYGYSGLIYDYGVDYDVVAYSTYNPISGGSVTNALLDIYTDGPYNKNGKYVVIFIISNADITRTYWNGFLDDVTINQETTTLSFSQFTPMPLDNLLLNKLSPMFNLLTDNALSKDIHPKNSEKDLLFETIQKIKELSK